MKKYLIIILATIISALSITSCLVDEGNYDYKKLDEFYIDTVGKQVTFTVKQFSDLIVNSNLKYSGNKSDLTYRWSLYRPVNYSVGASKYPLPEAHGYDKDDFQNFIIAETENLTKKITAIPGAYTLQFEATDSKTGITAMMSYSVTIESTISTGLLVFYKGVNKVDMDVISTPLLNANITETIHSKNVFTRANPSVTFSGDPRLCLFVSSGSLVYAATDVDAKKLSRIDMSLASDFDDIFQEAPAKKDFWMPRSDMIINDGKYYKTTTWGLPIFVGPHEMKDNDTYYASTFATLAYGQNGVIYDQTKMRFLYAGMWDGFVQPVSALGTHFSFGNVGKKLIYGAAGYDAGLTYISFCVFKNPVENGTRYLYAFRTHVSSHSGYLTQGAIDISIAPQVANAEFWAFGERGPIVFYATKEKIYRLNYTLAGGATGATEAWSFGSSEQITFMKLFKYNGIGLSAVAKDKYLMVGTYNSSTGVGKLYMLESDISSGVISSTPAAVYTFSGKIGDVDFIAS